MYEIILLNKTNNDALKYANFDILGEIIWY